MAFSSPSTFPEKPSTPNPNAHNFYGDFKDLDSAKIEDVQKFYEPILRAE